MSFFIIRQKRAYEMRISDWSSDVCSSDLLGKPLRVGDKVAFTGCDERERKRLETRARELGVRVMNNVSRLTAMLVTDGSFAGGKLADALALGTRIVTPAEFATLLQHLQPARATSKTPVRANAAPTAGAATAFASQVSTTASPSDIRAWGLENGYADGVRGRLSTELIQAYELAMKE